MQRIMLYSTPRNFVSLAKSGTRDTCCTYVRRFTNLYTRQKLKKILLLTYVAHIPLTASGNIIADSDRAQRALSESGWNFEKGRKMTEKKNKEVSRDSTRYPAGQANAENSQGAEIVRLLLD